MVSQKASREAWLKAGCSALRRGGFRALQVEPLASELGVTKGSFYWHFRDRGDLLEALLASWEQETDILISAAPQSASPLARLISFFVQVEDMSGYPPDNSVFELARVDRSVAARASCVEQKRIAYFAEQLGALGLEAAEAREAAEIVYSTSIGWLEFARRDNRDPKGFADAAIRVVAGQLGLARSGDRTLLDVLTQEAAS